MPVTHPRLKSHLTIEVLSKDRAFVVGEDRSVMLEGAAQVALPAVLDGTRTVPEVAGALAAQGIAIRDVFVGLRKLEILGLIAEGRPDIAERELAYWDASDVDASRVASELPAARVAVLTVGEVDAEPFVQAILGAGVHAELVDDPVKAAEADLVLAVVDDYLTTALEAINRAMLDAGTPWLLTKPSGVRVWLGPLLRPGETGCWEDIRQRLSENRQVERWLLGRNDRREPFPTSKPNPPHGSDTAVGLLLPEIVEALATGRSTRLDGQMVTLDRRMLETMKHVLIKQPQCPVCGDATLITERPARVGLTEREVRFSSDGGYRTEPPEVTYERLSKHISPVLGAVTSLSPVTESESGVTHAYAAGHNFAMIGDNLQLLRRNLRGQSGGKGRTDIQAKVSGVAEAIERYSGVWRGTEPVVRASYEQLTQRRVHMSDILVYSADQYGNREETNKHESGRFGIIPHPFREDFVCDWTTMWSLTNDEPVLVPSGYVWFGHPDLAEHFFCFGDGNGNAAGSVPEEAILQGICELVERDAVAIWWYNRLQRPGFDLDSLDDPYVETLRRYYRTMGRELWMLDITSDLGIPTFAAVSSRAGGPTEDIGLGFGSHIDPYIAAMRALTEMNQFLPAIARHNPDGTTIYWEDDPTTLSFWQNTKLAEEPWLSPNAEPARTVADHRGLVKETMTDDLRGVLDRIHGAGLEVLVTDQSRPDLDLSVYKTIIPGMRHFWRRLGPGRLYDVPVQMGWLDSPTPEDQLNPLSVFF